MLQNRWRIAACLLAISLIPSAAYAAFSFGGDTAFSLCCQSKCVMNPSTGQHFLCNTALDCQACIDRACSVNNPAPVAKNLCITNGYAACNNKF